MNIEKYEQLTGHIVPTDKRTFFEAQIKRVQAKLETLLGYTLEPSHIYTEIGQTQRECDCPNIPKTLLPADAVKGIWKVFPYNHKDKYLNIDPYNQVYTVKLVRVLDNKQFITYKTFDAFSQVYMRDGIGKQVERCNTCFCECDCKDCVLLAVDADWLDFEDESVPSELLYLWCDMVDFYANPNRHIKSESVDGHSWSVGEVEAPEDTSNAILLLRRYAGPYGSVVRMPTT